MAKIIFMTPRRAYAAEKDINPHEDHTLLPLGVKIVQAPDGILNPANYNERHYMIYRDPFDKVFEEITLSCRKLYYHIEKEVGQNEVPTLHEHAFYKCPQQKPVQQLDAGISTELKNIDLCNRKIRGSEAQRSALITARAIIDRNTGANMRIFRANKQFPSTLCVLSSEEVNAHLSRMGVDWKPTQVRYFNEKLLMVGVIKTLGTFRILFVRIERFGRWFTVNPADGRVHIAALTFKNVIHQDHPCRQEAASYDQRDKTQYKGIFARPGKTQHDKRVNYILALTAAQVRSAVSQ
ncbi:pili subunit/adhesion motif protein [Ranid herpesvirus 3]|uniref:Pili subunit/adhesion motif protein n=1 Tax=Ranid herpesvirus 3 TaxID=1987509 RepID=A0A1X9T540_9VIRU|nr:pili subunit/adhesion motif protein [Ranid herpesvirus 3]ARR28820.1 pili subunit/adhesion motif protein [Ranid herpesvirus 3]